MTPDTQNLPLLPADGEDSSNTDGGCCGGGCCGGNAASTEESTVSRPD